jgi:hypothetical protein
VKIFISHATIDAQLAEALINLLETGIGVPHKDIFCSSQRSSVPNGDFFVKRILVELNAAELIISLLSQSYLKREFCLAEVGAALSRRIAGSAKFYSLYIPPVGTSDLGGVLHGVQSGLIQSPPSMGELRDIVTGGVYDYPTSVWQAKLDIFINTATRFVARRIGEDLSKKITVQDIYPERSTGAGVTYRAKLRVVLKNEAKEELEVGPAMWTVGEGGLSALTRRPPLFQVEGENGWRLNDWGQEDAIVSVPKDRAFRFWVGFEESTPDEEIRRLQVRKRLGVLTLPIVVGGERIKRQIRL